MDGGGGDGCGGHSAYGGPSPWSEAGRVPGVHVEDLHDVPARSAQHLVAHVRDGAAVPWLGLEVAAFARHPEVQDALDPRRRWRRPADALPAGALVALTLVAVLGVAVAVVLLGSEAGYGAPSPATTDRVAGVAAVVTLVALVARWASWLVTRLRGRRPVATDLWVLLGVVLAVHGTTTLGWLVTTGRWAPEVAVPTVAAVAVAGLAVVVAVVAQRVAPYPDAAPAGAGGDPVALAAALPAAERERVARDLARALDVVERRGLAAPDAVARARTAAPGALAPTAQRSARRARRQGARRQD
ncbi:hypothetical protein ACOACO_10820 [Nocardioides sp. CPCC 205120]|uniref:hypothetical protein n=1 Tax=Nocardioides sp. CPCC 205120 TaxID=3406462 RepID=UPI003B5035EA